MLSVGGCSWRTRLWVKLPNEPAREEESPQGWTQRKSHHPGDKTGTSRQGREEEAVCIPHMEVGGLPRKTVASGPDCNLEVKSDKEQSSPLDDPPREGRLRAE